MNPIYRSIPKHTSRSGVGASEKPNSAGCKASGRGTTVLRGARFALKALAVSVVSAFGSNAWAAPTGGAVSAGGATIASEGAGKMTINQSTQNVAINWQSFSIGQGEAVRFVQPNSSSVALNRVVGADPSSILGSLTANGKVFLVNPNGILFGKGAQVNVAGLVASTLNISDADFMAGKYKFAGTSNAQVLNQGSINADRGYVALLGANVSNEGVISANLGTVALAAGSAVTLDVAGDGLLNLVVNQGAVDALVQNGGLIRANGGQVLMTAQSAGNLLKSVVNNTGTIEAQTLENHNGTIRLLAGGQNGTVIVGGTLDASGKGAGETGGTVHVLAEKVGLFSARIDASGDAGGGTVLVGGDQHGANPAVQNALAVYMSKDSVINADAISAGNGGKVILWSDNITRFYGNISARGGSQGGDGGFTEVSGKNHLEFRGKVDLRAPMGKTGMLLLDPENIIIQAAGADVNGDAIPGDDLNAAINSPNLFFSDYAGLTSFITTAEIVNQLATADVTLQANNDITVNSIVSWNTAHTLDLTARHDVIINAALTATAVGAGIRLSADNDVRVLAALSTTGANTSIQLSARHDVRVDAGVSVSGADSKINIGAAHDVLINAAVSAAGANAIVDLRADNDGTGPGLVGGTVTFAGAGSVTAPNTIIRFNPNGYANTSVEIANYDVNVAGGMDAKAWVFAQGNDKVYDGTTAATLSFRGNPIAGGAVTLVPGTANFDTKNVGPVKPIAFTGYSVAGPDVAKFALFAVAVNEPAYLAVVGSGNTSAAITPATLTITANNATKNYGETATFATSAFTSTGLVNAETVGTVTETSPGTLATAGVAGNPWAIIPSNAGAGTFSPSNYNINYVNGTLIVIPVALTVTASSATKIFGETPALSAFTQVGLMNGETIGSVTETSAGTAAGASIAGGPYAITASNAGGGTFTPSNYAISYTSGVLSVTAGPSSGSSSGATSPSVTSPSTTSPGTTSPGDSSGGITTPDDSGAGGANYGVSDTTDPSSMGVYAFASGIPALAGLNITVAGAGVRMPPVMLAAAQPVSLGPIFAQPEMEPLERGPVVQAPMPQGALLTGRPIYVAPVYLRKQDRN